MLIAVARPLPLLPPLLPLPGQLVHERPLLLLIEPPPLAIYVRRVALFLFWCWFFMRSFSFLLASSIALDIAISHPLISWLRACSVGLGGLHVRRLI